MRCPSCGRANATGCLHCTACGRPLPPPCPACGTETEAGARFCGRCGTALPVGDPGAVPTAVGGGRYHVQRFIGEGRKKRVYLAREVSNA